MIHSKLNESSNLNSSMSYVEEVNLITESSCNPFFVGDTQEKFDVDGHLTSREYQYGKEYPELTAYKKLERDLVLQGKGFPICLEKLREQKPGKCFMYNYGSVCDILEISKTLQNKERHIHEIIRCAPRFEHDEELKVLRIANALEFTTWLPLYFDVEYQRECNADYESEFGRDGIQIDQALFQLVGEAICCVFPTLKWTMLDWNNRATFVSTDSSNSKKFSRHYKLFMFDAPLDADYKFDVTNGTSNLPMILFKDLCSLNTFVQGALKNMLLIKTPSNKALFVNQKSESLFAEITGQSTTFVQVPVIDFSVYSFNRNFRAPYMEKTDGQNRRFVPLPTPSLLLNRELDEELQSGMEAATLMKNREVPKYNLNKFCARLVSKERWFEFFIKCYIPLTTRSGDDFDAQLFLLNLITYIPPNQPVASLLCLPKTSHTTNYLTQQSRVLELISRKRYSIDNCTTEQVCFIKSLCKKQSPEPISRCYEVKIVYTGGSYWCQNKQCEDASTSSERQYAQSYASESSVDGFEHQPPICAKISSFIASHHDCTCNTISGMGCSFKYSKWFPKKRVLYLTSSICKKCDIAHREHKSNHIGFVVNCNNGTYYQICTDSDCKGKCSPSSTLPPELLKEIEDSFATTPRLLKRSTYVAQIIDSIPMYVEDESIDFVV